MEIYTIRSREKLTPSVPTDRAEKFTPSVPKDKISISPLLVLAIFRTMVVLVGTCRPTPFWGRVNGKGNPAPG